MTDQVDSDLDNGTDGLPNSSASGGQGDQPNSETVKLTKAEWNAVQSTIKRLDDQARSDKDRAVKRTNERMDKFESEFRPMLERAAPLLAKGASVEDVMAGFNKEETDQAIREMALAWRSGTLPNTAGGTSGGGVNMTEIIPKYGLSADDPLVVAELQGKSFKTEIEAKAAIADVIAKKVNLPIPTQAQVPSSPERPAGSPDVKALTEKYRQETLAARGKKEEAKAIKERYRKMGVPVDSVNFSV